MQVGPCGFFQFHLFSRYVQTLQVQDFVPLTIRDLANHVQRELIRDQACIFKKQPFIEVLERECRRGMNWLSLISTPGGLDDPLILLPFLAGILFTSSVSWHHNTSLIFHQGSLEVSSQPLNRIVSVRSVSLAYFLPHQHNRLYIQTSKPSEAIRISSTPLLFIPLLIPKGVLPFLVPTMPCIPLFLHSLMPVIIPATPIIPHSNMHDTFWTTSPSIITHPGLPLQSPSLFVPSPRPPTLIPDVCDHPP